MLGPGARKVVCHDVDEVEVCLSGLEIDVAQGPFARWEGNG